jgi:hypothetical protein
MPRTAISGLVCTTFLVLLGFPAVPQEPAGKGADTESGQQTFNKARPSSCPRVLRLTNVRASIPAEILALGPSCVSHTPQLKRE